MPAAAGRGSTCPGPEPPASWPSPWASSWCSFFWSCPSSSFLFFAYSNGYIVPNEAREGRKSCVDAQGEKVPCCTWQPAGWVPPYMSLASLSLLWTAATLSQLRVFVISGDRCAVVLGRGILCGRYLADPAIRAHVFFRIPLPWGRHPHARPGGSQRPPTGTATEWK
eukprot:jgi/Botrbrau1/20951/Bobra.0135s0070.1